LPGVSDRIYDWLADADDLEPGRLTAVLAELSSGRNIGLYLRQLPISGIDSKWIGADRARVTDLLRLLIVGDHEGDATGDLWTITGLRREPALLRLRLLDPQLHAVVGGLDDAERLVYEGLSRDRWGSAVRLEQEPIGWDYAWRRIIGDQATTRSNPFLSSHAAHAVARPK